MPVTIGNVTSNVNLVDTNNTMSEAMVEQIIQRVMARLKDEKYAEDQAQQEREISDRATAAEPF